MLIMIGSKIKKLALLLGDIKNVFLSSTMPN